MSSTCTWQDCSATAQHEQVADDGDAWANLCAEHNQKLQASMASGDQRAIIADWIRAQGGPMKASRRLAGLRPRQSCVVCKGTGKQQSKIYGVSTCPTCKGSG